MLSGEFRPYFMSACTQGGVFEFAESARDPGIRFASVFECPVVEAAMESVVKRAPQGGNFQPGAPNYWTFSQTKEYEMLRFAMQSFPSKWFDFSIHLRHTLLTVITGDDVSLKCFVLTF